MVVEIFVLIVLSGLASFILLTLKSSKKVYQYRKVNREKSDKKNLRELAVFHMSDDLREQMSYSNMMVNKNELKIVNSGPDTCIKRKIKIRSFGDDQEMIIDRQSVRMS